MSRAVFTTAALATLAACAASEPEAVTNPDPAATADSFTIAADGSGDLSFTGFDGTGQIYGGNDVSFVNLDTGVITGGEFAGQLNASRTQIALDSGGTVFLTNPGGTEYVRFFVTEPTTGEPVAGVVGFVTNSTDMPLSGASQYTGAGSLVATDTRALYDFNGTAVVTADFGSGIVDIELGSLSGTQRDASGVRTVTNGGTILVEGSRISGASFSGGTAFAVGTPFDFSGGQDAGQTNGAFFGPDADEVAGRIVVDDPDADVAVFGRFAVD